MTKPLALTMGEPAGIGPEIKMTAWREAKAKAIPPFFVIGDPALYDGCQEIETPEEALAVFKKNLPVLPLKLRHKAKAGTLDAANAEAVIQSIEQAVAFCHVDRASAVVTNPIHKAVLKEANFEHPGHTEFIAHLCGNITPVMMLAAKDLRVVPLTVHIALKDVPESITQKLIVEKTRIVNAALKQDYGLEKPRIALAGLNPHAGEEGQFGREDIEVLKPAIAQLQSEGIAITGPHPADTLFHEEARARYDIALCCYHDQALIPLKTLDFHGGVNVTLGLPIVRTSPDHGTALDIAGKGMARADSLIAALKMAAKIASVRRG
jgi:4-hydroxythreonine-4-phosphate dehydrogenase